MNLQFGHAITEFLQTTPLSPGPELAGKHWVPPGEERAAQGSTGLHLGQRRPFWESLFIPRRSWQLSQNDAAEISDPPLSPDAFRPPVHFYHRGRHPNHDHIQRLPRDLETSDTTSWMNKQEQENQSRHIGWCSRVHFTLWTVSVGCVNLCNRTKSTRSR
jgi:hypothetical protein